MLAMFYHTDVHGIINLCLYHIIVTMHIIIYTYMKCNIKVNKLVFKTKYLNLKMSRDLSLLQIVTKQGALVSYSEMT